MGGRFDAVCCNTVVVSMYFCPVTTTSPGGGDRHIAVVCAPLYQRTAGHGQAVSQCQGTERDLVRSCYKFIFVQFLGFGTGSVAVSRYRNAGNQGLQSDFVPIRELALVSNQAAGTLRRRENLDFIAAAAIHDSTNGKGNLLQGGAPGIHGQIAADRFGGQRGIKLIFVAVQNLGHQIAHGRVVDPTVERRTVQQADGIYGGKTGERVAGVFPIAEVKGAHVMADDLGAAGILPHIFPYGELLLMLQHIEHAVRVQDGKITLAVEQRQIQGVDGQFIRQRVDFLKNMGFYNFNPSKVKNLP